MVNVISAECNVMVFGSESFDLLPVNFVQQLLATSFTMGLHKVLSHPSYQMVLECPFDDLMKVVSP